MEQESHTAPNKRAIHADTLQIGTHLEFKFATQFSGVPTLNGFPDRPFKLPPVRFHPAANPSPEPFIHAHTQLRILLYSAAQ
jgi:hypothetical protein